MKHPNIIDCYKLDLIKDIPLELDLLTQHRDRLLLDNQKLKKIILALGIGFGFIIIYKIVTTNGKKQRKNEEEVYFENE
ncbi:hypothetical protein IWQ47_003491 [Aquimarina sp. EL_43]|uniref:hypothetical protein n=1 Tax=unclassified Aquimarina TaxID=2627091 RepID=UPI0018CB2E78|nr:MULTISPECIES: hypothetical protein [unclassified Aquimarina]MBG6131767.1 hypothetical protein [Aquimarina sp. EL_35]MBG6149331.1 hypothetical protein [Aquimarina sp. EL_32]MBG6170406.1 hypothetical protein [Aquimarina sp. EL_43]